MESSAVNLIFVGVLGFSVSVKFSFWNSIGRVSTWAPNIKWVRVSLILIVNVNWTSWSVWFLWNVAMRTLFFYNDNKKSLRLEFFNE